MADVATTLHVPQAVELILKLDPEVNVQMVGVVDDHSTVAPLTTVGDMLYVEPIRAFRTPTGVAKPVEDALILAGRTITTTRTQRHTHNQHTTEPTSQEQATMQQAASGPRPSLPLCVLCRLH